MSYGLIDDQAHSNPKFAIAGSSATGVYWLAVSWARCHLDRLGVIPAATVTRLGGDDAAAEALVSASLWDAVEGGYYIHGYAEMYSKTDAKRVAIAEARSEYGRKGARARWDAQADATSEAQQEPKHKPRQTDAPSPTPRVGTDVPTGRTPLNRQKPKRYTEEGEALAKELWETFTPKPIVGFIAFRERISEAISAGHSPDVIRRIAPHVAVWTRAAIDFELRRNQPVPDSGPIVPRHSPELDAVIAASLSAEPYRANAGSIDALVAGMTG